MPYWWCTVCRSGAVQKTRGIPGKTLLNLWHEASRSLDHFGPDCTDLNAGGLYIIEDLSESYSDSSKILDSTCAPLNRVIEECPEKGHKIYQLAMITWRESFFKNVEKQVANTILKLIERQLDLLLKVSIQAYSDDP